MHRNGVVTTPVEITLVSCMLMLVQTFFISKAMLINQFFFLVSNQNIIKSEKHYSGKQGIYRRNN
jgi:hypothetical protein